MYKNEFIIGVAISSSLMILILFVVLFFFFKSKSKNNVLRKKGAEAERLVNQKIYLWSNIHDYLYIPSAMFKYDKNKIFEVDGILITDRALIVIEVKSINGNKIYGKGNEKEWFKVVGNNTHPIKSPILQNDRHIDHIIKMTNMKIPMISLIIFDGNSVGELDIERIPDHCLVIKSEDIEATLDTIGSVLIPRVTKNEMIKIHENLMSHKTSKKEDKKLLETFAKEFNEKTFTI